MTRVAAGVLTACLVVTACASVDDGESDEAATTAVEGPAVGAGPSTTAVADPVPNSSAPSAPTAGPTSTSVAPPGSSTTPPGTVAPEPNVSDVGALTASLADDALGGRENGSAGSEAARTVIVGWLADAGVEPAGSDGWLQPFDVGFNVIGMISGSDLADEYVVVGAHYDHLGEVGCSGRTPDDTICNGAADNAAGVAVALVVAEAIAEIGPRRSVVVALWDAEEDGLLGAEHYLTDPVVPLDQTVAYVNFDILGSNLLPSLANWTVMIGAETGGEPLAEITRVAIEGAPLSVVHLSLLFGQGRSDHAPFAASGIPIVFMSDASNGCYHTVDDEFDRIDVDKLDAQVGIAARLVGSLASTDSPPVFTPDAPVVTFSDAEQLLAITGASRADLPLLGGAAPDIERFLDGLTEIVGAGPGEFDDGDVGFVLEGAAALVDALDSGPCL